eukprot:COSAG06_NODE_597_length_13926_cov_11.086497_3_plen_212_part_00
MTLPRKKSSNRGRSGCLVLSLSDQTRGRAAPLSIPTLRCNFGAPQPAWWGERAPFTCTRSEQPLTLSRVASKFFLVARINSAAVGLWTGEPEAMASRGAWLGRLVVACTAVWATPAAAQYGGGTNITIQTWETQTRCRGTPDRVDSFLPGGARQPRRPPAPRPIAAADPRSLARSQSARRSRRSATRSTRRGCGCSARRSRVSSAICGSRW